MNKEHRITMESILIDCVRILAMEADFNKAVNQFMQYIGEFYNANRTYIFEFDLKNEVINNTYEWCKEGVTSEIDRLQNIPLHYINPWMKKFEETGDFFLNSLEEYYHPDSDAYKILDNQGIKTLMAAPLVRGDKIVGFLGLDDPTCQLDNQTLLKVSAYLVIEEINKRKLIEQLEMASYTDLLTGLKNRNQYVKKLAEYENRKPESFGAIFADINGLKEANDFHGHEYGDKMIVEIARVIKKVSNTIVYRVGGDEFLILYENIDQKDFEEVVDGLKKALLELPDYNVSVGGHWVKGDLTVEEVVSMADQAMYREKENYYKMQCKCAR